MRSPFPHSVCFRITRHCNANCCFCLAPADGATADLATLKHRVDWLLERGVREIHLCGGEPTIHPALPDLLFHIHSRNAKTRITTNGIELTEVIVAALRATGTRVKVSLHGDRSHHNRIVGRPAFDQTVHNLQRLIRVGVKASVQTTVVAGALGSVDWMIEFCLHEGVKRLTLLPFLPRGAGLGRRDELELSAWQRSMLHNHVKQKRRALGNRVDLRWLDMAAKRLCVVEVDGRIVLQGGSERSDRLVCEIPAVETVGATSSYCVGECQL